MTTAKQQLKEWRSSDASARLMDMRSADAFQRRQLINAVSVPLAEIEDRWFELPGRQCPFALLLPSSEHDGFVIRLKSRGWAPNFVFYDTDALWTAAEELQLVITATTADCRPNATRFLFSPSPLLEKHITAIEAQLVAERQLAHSDAALVAPFWMLDVGCGSGRDVAWTLSHTARSTDVANMPCWSVCAVDAWRGALQRTSQLLTSRQFSAERARLIRAQFLANGTIRYQQAPASDYTATTETEACGLLESRRYDLVIAVRFLERAAFSILDRAVRPGGFLLYSTFVDGVCTYEQPASSDHRLQPGELAAFFGPERGYSVIEDDLMWTEDGRPLSAFLARKNHE